MRAILSLILLGSGLLPLCAQKTVLIGSGIRNGDFNDDTDPTDQRTFEQTPFWVNVQGNQGLVTARTNLVGPTGTRNAQLNHSQGNLLGQDTGHTLAEGDSFDVSYFWRDAFNWDDQVDKVRIILFVTDDDDVFGPRTIIASADSPLSTMNDTYEPVVANDIYIADATHVGKQLFVGIDTFSADGNGFARFDDFQLSVGDPSSDPLLKMQSGDFLFGDLVHPPANNSSSRTVEFQNLGTSNSLTVGSVALSDETDEVFTITSAPSNGTVIAPDGTFSIEVTATGGSQFTDYSGELILTIDPDSQSLTLPISANISNGAEVFETGSTILVDFDDEMDNGIHEESIRNGGFEEGTADETLSQTPVWQSSFSPEGDFVTGTLSTSPSTGDLHGQTSGFVAEIAGDERTQPAQEISMEEWTLEAGDTFDIRFSAKGGTGWTGGAVLIIVEVLDEFGAFVNDPVNGMVAPNRWASPTLQFEGDGSLYETFTYTTPEIPKDSPWIGNHARVRVLHNGSRTVFMDIDDVTITGNFRRLLPPSGILEITSFFFNPDNNATSIRFTDSGAVAFSIESADNLNFSDSLVIPLDGTEERDPETGEIEFTFVDPSVSGSRHFWRVLEN